MNGANQSLSEFVGFLSNPDMYGSMSTAAGMMSWLLQLVVFVLMICAVIGVAFIVFKFACDIVFLSGLGHMLSGGNGSSSGKVGNFLGKFASEGAQGGDIFTYLKKDAWKLIITLAFLGILASGSALPLAGQVAGVAGAMINKLVGLDVAGKIEDFDYTNFSANINVIDPDVMKSEYDKYLQEAKTYLNQVYSLGNSGEVASGNVELQQKINLYVMSLSKAHAVGLKASGASSAVDGYYAAHLDKSVCNKTLTSSSAVQSVPAPVKSCSSSGQ